VTWIWSDELAAAAEADGLDGEEIAVWKRQPVAYPLHIDLPVGVLARRLLGLEVRDANAGDAPTSAPDRPAPSRCTCGNSDLAVTLVSDAIGIDSANQDRATAAG